MVKVFVDNEALRKAIRAARDDMSRGYGVKLNNLAALCRAIAEVTDEPQFWLMAPVMEEIARAIRFRTMAEDLELQPDVRDKLNRLVAEYLSHVQKSFLTLELEVAKDEPNSDLIYRTLGSMRAMTVRLEEECSTVAPENSQNKK